MMPAQALAQSVSVHFQVQMSYQVEQGNFDPDTQFVDVAGSFNGWDGSEYELQPQEGEEGAVYAITVDDFTPGEDIAFKFRIDGAWDGNEEFPGGGPDRSFTVSEQPEENEIFVWYNDELPPTGPPLADFSPQSSRILEGGAVLFEDRSGGRVTQWEWHFEGGNPAVSHQENPVISYAQSGSYDVTLIAGHEDLADTLTVSDAVEVNIRESTETHWWNHTVFYEMFARSFFDSSGDGTGDFAGMIEKLDYLNDGNPETTDDLGITGIWLMPIHESPSYHGYDVLDYTSVNPDYGTMQEFRDFVDAAQERGIRVIIDFVLNHSSSEHPWFINSRNNVEGYRDYYRWRDTHPGYNGPWGQPVWHQWGNEYYYGIFWSGMPDLNYENEEMKEKVFQAADFWLSDVGVDGFRLDAVTYIFEDGDQLAHTEETFEFWHEFNERVKSNNPEAVTVGEAWTSTDQIIPYVTEDRLDFAFEFDLASAILNAVRSGDARNLRSQMQLVYNSYDYQQFATFLTNHDQNRVMNELGGDWEQAKTAASIYLSLPGVPFLYYGEEIGMTGTKPDPEIRTPMQWDDGPQAGFTTGSPWIDLNDDYELRNVAVQEADPNSLLNHYKDLIHLRNNEIALRTGDYQPGSSDARGLYSFMRTYEDEQLLVLVNLSNTPLENAAVQLPPGVAVYEPGSYALEDLLGGSTTEIEISSGNRVTGLSMAGQETIILSLAGSVPVSSEPAREQGERPGEIRLHQNYPNPFNPETTIRYELPEAGEVRVEIFNVLGQRVTVLADGPQTAGQHMLRFDAGALSSGMYLYRLSTPETTLTRKMMLLK